MSARIAQPRPDVLRRVGAAVQRYDADLMKFLDEDHHVTRALDDLVRVVVGGRKHRRAGIHVDAARSCREILGLIILSALLALFRRPVRRAFLSLWGHG